MSNISAYGSITVTDLLDTATYIYYSATNTSTLSSWHTSPQSNDEYIGIYSGPPTDSGQPANPTSAIYSAMDISKYVGDDGNSVTNVRELYWLKTNSTNPSQITWNSSTSQPSQTIYSTDRQNSWTSMVPTYITNGTYYTCIETSLSDGTKVWSTPVVNQALTNTNSNAVSALGQVTNLDNRLKTFFWPGDSSYSGAFSVAKTSNDGLDVTDANTYGFNTRVATGLVSIGYNKIPLSEWGINEGLKMYYPILDDGRVVDNKLGMQLSAGALNLYNPTLSYKAYEGTVGNPQELRLYEYSDLDETYILTQDTTFLLDKTYYENDVVKGLEIDNQGITIYDTNISPIIAIKQNIFSLGFNLTDTIPDDFDPYSESISFPYIIWKKTDSPNEESKYFLYEKVDDIFIRTSEDASYSLKKEIEDIREDILNNSISITNIQTDIIEITSDIATIEINLDLLENKINQNLSSINTNTNNITINSRNITITNNRINKIKAYWKIDTNNHLSLIEEVL